MRNLFGTNGLDTVNPYCYDYRSMSKLLLARSLAEKVHCNYPVPIIKTIRVTVDILSSYTVNLPIPLSPESLVLKACEAVASFLPHTAIVLSFFPEDDETSEENADELKNVHAYVLAAWIGNFGLLQKIHKLSLLNAKSLYFGTPLMAAATSGSLEVVEFLLREGASVNFECGYRMYAMWSAAWEGHTDVVHFLLRNGAFIYGDEDKFSPTEEFYENAFGAAARRNHTAIIELFIQHMEMDEEKSLVYGYAVFCALEGKHFQLAQSLIQSGADCNQVVKGQTVLSMAATAGNIRIVEELLAQGLEVDKMTDEYSDVTRLIGPAYYGNIEIIRLLVNSYAALGDFQEHYGRALHVAVSRGHFSTAEFLLEKGANPNFPGWCEMVEDSRTACSLEASVLSGDEAMVGLLLQYGADPNGVRRVSGYHNRNTAFSSSPLALACMEGHIAIVSMLLGAGANMEDSGLVKARPIQIASDEGHQEIVELLISHGSEKPVIKDRKVPYKYYREGIMFRHHIFSI
jgi:ankyrin repeat protein